VRDADLISALLNSLLTCQSTTCAIIAVNRQLSIQSVIFHIHIRSYRPTTDVWNSFEKFKDPKPVWSSSYDFKLH